MPKFRILIVCPEPAGLALLTSMLKSLGHLIEEAATDRVAVRLMERNTINLVLACVDPGDTDALELLAYVRRKHPDVSVILMFPRLHPGRAKEALRLGAMAVLKYPIPAAELRAAVLQALQQCEARPAEVSAPPGPGLATRPAAPAWAPPSALETSPCNGPGPSSAARGPTPGVPGANASPMATAPPGPEGGAMPLTRMEALAQEVDLIAADPCLRQIVELTGALGTTRSSVLIVGEPGTGKSLLAHLLHLGVGPTERPFVTLQAAELAEASSLAEEPAGAAPPVPAPALVDWSTKLTQARGGTLHIEEVGALPPEIQFQLLRELQLQDIEAAVAPSRIPGRADARFVLSTSENLPALVEQGRFRPELYHRISAICLMVPPLRLRGADIELLAEHFRAGFSQEFRKHVVGFTRDALDTLQRHDWPGNVRELKGVIQRAVALCSGSRISSSHLAPILNPHHHSRDAGGKALRPHRPMGIRPLKEALHEPEKRIIIQALQASNWNRQETARVLEINRTTLYKKMKKYGLLMDEPSWVN